MPLPKPKTGEPRKQRRLPDMPEAGDGRIRLRRESLRTDLALKRESDRRPAKPHHTSMIEARYPVRNVSRLADDEEPWLSVDNDAIWATLET